MSILICQRVSLVKAVESESVMSYFDSPVRTSVMLPIFINLAAIETLVYRGKLGSLSKVTVSLEEFAGATIFCGDSSM